MLKKIIIKGAKEHNLKNVSLELPKDNFVITVYQALVNHL